MASQRSRSMLGTAVAVVALLARLAGTTTPAASDPAPAVEVWVDAAQGRDSPQAAGSLAAPFQTLPYALGRLPAPTQGGATVWLRSGAPHTLNRTLTLDAAASGLTIATWAPDLATTGRAAITGALRVPGSAWQRSPPSARGRAGAPPTFVAPVPAAALAQHVPQQMFVAPSGTAARGGGGGGGAAGSGRRQRARHPNLFGEAGVEVQERPYLFWANPLCQPPRSPQCAQVNRFGLQYGAGDAEVLGGLSNVGSGPLGARPQAVVYHGWTASRHLVAAVDAGNRSLLFRNPADRPIGNWLGLSSEGGQRYYLENDRSLLDGRGEWFLDLARAQLSYIPLEAEEASMAELDAFLPMLTELLVLNGTSNVTFQGIDILHSDWQCGGSDGLLTCDHQSVAWQLEAAVNVWHSSDIRFLGCNLKHHGASAIWANAGARRVRVESSTIADLGSSGVRVGVMAGSAVEESSWTKDVALINTTLTDGSHAFPGGTAVLVHLASRVNISHNDISRFSYTAISLGWNWSYEPMPAISENGHHTVHRNRIAQLGYPRRETGDAMACIYTLGQLNGTSVDNNVCTDVRAYMSGGYCLSQDQGSSFIAFTNNVCLRTTGSPHNTHYGVNLTYANNVFYGGGHESWVPPDAEGGYAAALRTSPTAKPCGAADQGLPNACPDRLHFEGNLVGLWDNASALLFEGDFNSSSHPGLAFRFDRNLYWSECPALDLAQAHAFGGMSHRTTRADPRQYTWAQWNARGQDTAGAVLRWDPAAGAGGGLFLDPAWRTSLNVTVRPQSRAVALGWRQIDTSSTGLLKPH